MQFGEEGLLVKGNGRLDLERWAVICSFSRPQCWCEGAQASESDAGDQTNNKKLFDFVPHQPAIFFKLLRVVANVRSGGLWAPANLMFKALHPLMAAMVQMCALGQESFVAAAGWNGGSVLCQGMPELLAGDAHHG